MNKNIDDLLRKYFEAETSLEEEQLLQTYFQQHKDEIKKEHHKFIGIFSYFQEEKNEIAEVEKIQETPKNKRLKLSNWYVWSLIAASIVILAVILIPNYDTNSLEQSVVYIDGIKIDNEKILYIETLNSLQDVQEGNNEIISSQIEILDSLIDF